MDREDAQRMDFRVFRSYPHDPGLYTQGLLWWDGLLYESTGRYGRSALVAWDPETGEVRDRADLPPELFGEGLARIGEELIQLTWRNGVALRWSLPPFRRIGEFAYGGEGWGLAFDGERLIMSHGSDVLTIRDPKTFEVLDRISVTRAGEPVSNLNELEAAEGWIYANVWTSEEILRIDRGTGVVTAVIDASGLLSPSEARGVDVFNGIAYRSDTETFFVTGKLWPRVFEGTFGRNDSR
ncbi:MAG: glutaminyl-peptide cyclotransferase [Thermoanaerobaculia bacterium]|nr:glutaminyl-peptide cyclotransferase [Thermoanaerobaculia bacterium]